MTTDDTVNGRVDAWTARRELRLGGHNPWQITVDAVRSGIEHRVTGLAAEMAFFAALALIPITVAFGGVLGYVAPWAGAGGIENTEQVVTEVMTIILGPELVVDVAGPYVQAQLQQARGGLAVGGFIAGLWLASRVFLPAVLALDLAYGAVGRRTALQRRAVAMVLAIGSLVVITVQVLLLVFGPLLGGARELAERFDLSTTFTVLWAVFRWPALGAVLALFLLTVYRYAPARRIGWRRSLPGTAVAVVVWLLASAGLRTYLATGIAPTQGLDMATEALTSVGRALGALVATVLWVFLSSVAVLFGGEINAAIDRRRRAGN